MLELKAEIKSKEDVAEFLRAKSPIYSGHRKLASEVVLIRLRAASVETLHTMCRLLNTSIEGLMAYVDNNCQEVSNYD